jgi:hypothetical protein
LSQRTLAAGFRTEFAGVRMGYGMETHE